MQKLFKSTRSAVIVLGALALVIAITGGAVAATKGGGKAKKAKTITVCVSKADGTLYQARKCGKNKKLTWNKQGPAGPRGPQGPQGERGHAGPEGKAGPAGANGAVAAFFAAKDEPVDITQTKGNFETILSKQLPAGSYIVTGQATLGSGDSDPTPQAASSGCRLRSGPNVSVTATWISNQAKVFLFQLSQGSVSVQMPVTLANPGAVELECRSTLTSPPPTFNASVLNATISAIQVNSIG